jgi:hypothetical protein
MASDRKIRDHEDRHNDSRSPAAKGTVSRGYREKDRVVALLPVARGERPYRAFARHVVEDRPALDLPIAQFFADDSMSHQFNTQKLSPTRSCGFLTQIRRYSSNLNESDRKLLLAMVKKFAATAVR